MKIEDQVCNVELAKQLEELGVEQDSVFWWWHSPLDDEWKILYDPGTIYRTEGYSAFTIAELETEIFKIFENDYDFCYDFVVSHSPTGGTWEGETFNEMYEVQLINLFDTTDSIMERADTGANVRVKILICLIEHQRDKYTK